MHAQSAAVHLSADAHLLTVHHRILRKLSQHVTKQPAGASLLQDELHHSFLHLHLQ